MMDKINNYPKFTVSMSVYQNDNPEYFLKALESVVNQTIHPDEIIIVVDGPVPEKTNNILNMFASNHKNIKVSRLKKNMGHGYARNLGLQKSSHDYVAIMDSDDICLKNRFELQLQFLRDNRDISVLGGIIKEFWDETDTKFSKRKLPETDLEIKKYMKYRCPFNQMSVMMKKDHVLNVGGYKDWFCNEDYYLWIRMALNNYKFHNLQETLVKVRADENYFKRRGGLKYFKSEVKIQKLMLSKGIISLPIFIYNVVIRFVVQILLNEKLRKYFFNTFARSN